MEIREYIRQVKELYDLFIIYIEDADDDTDDFHNLTYYLETQNYLQSKEKVEQFLRIIIQISNNHHRISNFFSKIERMIDFLKDNIKQFFSNLEIYNIFESNKRILLYVITQNLVTIDQSIYELIFGKVGLNGNRYCHFFMPEIEKFVKNEKNFEFDLQNIDNYEEKRQIGENDSYICSLIRTDSIENFVAYVNQTNYSLHRTINGSIFETNSFLIENNPTLIEYAAFFGSIQIFQFLKLNNVELKPRLWFYVIHGKNAEMIHLLEECNVDPENSSYVECFKEAIKCHHNEIAEYIKENLLNPNFDNLTLQQDFNEDFIDYVFNSNNFKYFPSDLYKSFEFFYLCKYDYSILVNFWLNKKQVMIENEIISNMNNL